VYPLQGANQEVFEMITGVVLFRIEPEHVDKPEFHLAQIINLLGEIPHTLKNAIMSPEIFDDEGNLTQTWATLTRV
jgi:hypothetical protein